MSTLTDQPTGNTQRVRPPHNWVGWLLRLALLALLLAVFSMYMQPDFLLTLADQLWSCL